MSQAQVPRALRARVRETARYRCGYCLITEAIVGMPMEIEHIIPTARGGETVEDNLWLACSFCNKSKSQRVAAADPVTGQVVSLFDPRRQSWPDHFARTADGSQVIGLTAVGRATGRALNLNRPTLRAARHVWTAAGWHPPTE